MEGAAARRLVSGRALVGRFRRSKIQARSPWRKHCIWTNGHLAGQLSVFRFVDAAFQLDKLADTRVFPLKPGRPSTSGSRLGARTIFGVRCGAAEPHSHPDVLLLPRSSLRLPRIAQLPVDLSRPCSSLSWCRRCQTIPDTLHTTAAYPGSRWEAPRLSAPQALDFQAGLQTGRLQYRQVRHAVSRRFLFSTTCETLWRPAHPLSRRAFWQRICRPERGPNPDPCCRDKAPMAISIPLRRKFCFLFFFSSFLQSHICALFSCDNTFAPVV